MKSLYLDGHYISKPLFRELLNEGEKNIATGSVSTVSPLSDSIISIFPFETWRSARRTNFNRLVADLGGARHFQVLKPTEPQAAPFTVACVFPDADSCAKAKTLLVARDIYPSHLWSLEEPTLDGVPEEHIWLSRCMLALPCDGRYAAGDLDRVLEVFSETGLV